MPVIRSVLAAVALLPWWPGYLPAADFLIQNVTVLDLTTGAELQRRSILIHGDKIAAVGQDLRAPRQAEIIEGHGRFAIPGLWDMHVHLWHKEHLFPMYLAHGVTGLRD